MSQKFFLLAVFFSFDQMIRLPMPVWIDSIIEFWYRVHPIVDDYYAILKYSI